MLCPFLVYPQLPEVFHSLLMFSALPTNAPKLHCFAVLIMGLVFDIVRNDD